jgi:sugar phosphate isomerase/epimerase
MKRNVAVQIQFDKDCGTMLREAARAGFGLVSVGFGSYEGFVRDGWREDIAALKAALGALGLGCVMTHAPYYDLRISGEITCPPIDLSIARCLEATAMLGAGIMAMHPRGCYTSGTPYEGSVNGWNLCGLMPENPGGCYSSGSEDYARSADINAEYWKPLADRALRLGCKVGVENLPVWPNWNMTFCSNDPDAQIRIIDSLGEGACGVWDFGHAFLTHKGDVGPLKKLGSRIRGLHVHDNGGIGDDHLIPFDGTMDWKAQMEALKSTGFDGAILLELACVCDGNIGSFLARAYDAAVRLDGLLRG